MKLALGSAVLLGVVCAVICYRGPQQHGGSYSLPNIGKYPSPTVFNPKNHGLPDAYKNTRFRRSLDDYDTSVQKHFAEGTVLEELSRQRRSPGYGRIIQPTYRPPPQRPPKIYTA